jgi:N-sulfoglucosamine sulfohydrolase
VQLFDVEKDPWELENLADRPDLAAVRRDLEDRLRAWMQQQGDTGAALDVETAEQPAAKKKQKAKGPAA